MHKSIIEETDKKLKSGIDQYVHMTDEVNEIAEKVIPLSQMVDRQEVIPLSQIPHNSNRALSKMVINEIKDSGIKKTALAEKIGLSRQGLDVLLKKQSFSIDDANRILKPLHKHVEFIIKETK